jgi:hypothetical protein
VRKNAAAHQLHMKQAMLRSNIQGMKSKALVVCAAIGVWFHVAAQEIRAPYLAWEQHITNFTFAALIPDNIGHFAAVGYRENGASILLFDTNWNVVATAEACMERSSGYQYVKAIADSSGRVFVASAQTNSTCVRFEPGLVAMSRLPSWRGDEFYPFYPSNLVPDEHGGAYLGLARVPRPYGSYVPFHAHFSCDNVSFGTSRDGGDVALSIVARNPNGNVHRVYHKGWSRYPKIQVTTCDPVGNILWSTNVTPDFGDSDFPKNAICDGEGNLIIVGFSKDGQQEGPHYGKIFKLAADGTLLWHRQFPDAGTVRGVLTDTANNIYVTGDGGTMKYAPEGSRIWTNSFRGDDLRLTPRGDVVAYRPAIPIVWENWRTLSQGVDVAKVGTDGTTIWITNYAAETNSDQYFHNWAVGMIVDDANVYLAVTPGFGASRGVIVRFSDQPPVAESPRDVLDAPLAVTCEPENPGPCDTPPPPPSPPPPPPPAPVVTTTKLRGGSIAVCWPTNYSDYTLQAARHVNRRHPEKTKWKQVSATPVVNGTECCVTNSIAKYGAHYQIAAP